MDKQNNVGLISEQDISELTAGLIRDKFKVFEKVNKDYSSIKSIVNLEKLEQELRKDLSDFIGKMDV